jgi:hypothetical protein
VEHSDARGLLGRIVWHPSGSWTAGTSRTEWEVAGADEQARDSKPTGRAASIVLLVRTLTLYLIPTVYDLNQGVPVLEALGLGEVLAGILGCAAAGYLIRGRRR